MKSLKLSILGFVSFCTIAYGQTNWVAVPRHDTLTIVTLVQSTNALLLSTNSSICGQISGEFSTNWTTTSIEHPVVTGEAQFYAVMRYDTLHQEGVVSSNAVVKFQWGGKELKTILESHELFRTNRTTTGSPATEYNFKN